MKSWLGRSGYVNKLLRLSYDQRLQLCYRRKWDFPLKGGRERKNYFTAALCLGIPGVIMLLIPFIYIIALLPGDHGDSGDGLAWEIFFMFMTFFPIGLVLSAVALIMFDFGENLCK